MQKTIIIIAAVAVATLVALYGAYSYRIGFPNPFSSNDKTLRAEFEAWAQANGKTYGASESLIRFTNWKANRDLVNAHNTKNASYTLALNKFGDLTQAEFSAIYLGAKPQSGSEANCPAPRLSSAQDFPATIDWRQKGRVGAVKDQGQCGSCWAFATVAGLEGLYSASHTPLIFAEQQLVDCSGPQGNMGCGGGWVQWALQYVIAHGITTEDKYPYTATDGNCKSDLQTAFQPTGCANVKNTVNGLKQALQNGPTPVYVEADQGAFQFYSSGVVDDVSCFAEGQIDHAVTAVGYTDDAWIIRNSWGASWGESGYIRLNMETKKNPQGVCGILSLPAAYPIL